MKPATWEVMWALVLTIPAITLGYHLAEREARPNLDAKDKRIAELTVTAERVEFYESILQSIFGYVPQKAESLRVTVTAYSARPEETNSEPWVTADMSPSRVGMLAVSRDLLHEVGLEYGEVVILEGLGAFKVRDTMNKRFKRRVDILMAHPRAAIMFGKREAMLTWVRGEG